MDTSKLDATNGKISQKKTLFLWCAIIFIVGVGVYAPYLQNGWIFDDSALITKSQWYEQPFRAQDLTADLGEVLTDAPMHYWRPGQLLLYRLEYELFGERPAGWHLTAVLLHIATTICLFLFVLVFLSPHYAGVAALLFMLHPLTSEVVGSNNFQISSAEGLFVFLSLLAASRGRYLLVFLAVFAALGFRESAVVLPVLIAIFTFPRHDPDRKSSIPSIIAATLAVAAYLLIRFIILDHPMLAAENTLPMFSRMGVISFQTAKLLLFPLPRNLSIHHYLEPNTVTTLLGWLLITTLAAIGVLLFAWRNKKETCRRALPFFLAALVASAPYCGIVQPFVLFAEHYFYLPLAFLCATIATLLFKVASKRVLLSLVLILAVFYGAVSFTRAETFRDNFHAFSDVAQKYPNLFWAHMFLARHYLQEGNLPAAKTELETSIRINNGIDDDAWVLLGKIHYRENDPVQAEIYFRRARRKGLKNLAALLIAENRTDELPRILHAIKQDDPNEPIVNIIEGIIENQHTETEE